MENLSTAQQIAILALPVLFAITVHEVAHGWVAKQLGDPTAEMLGRLTLNPIKHIDPVGTILVPIVMMLLSGFLFGWARPVPVTWENLKQPKRDMALVAIAGPSANLLMALIWAAIAKLGLLLAGSLTFLSAPLVLMGEAGIFINFALMVLNLLPWPPLDGGRVMAGLLPGPWAWKLSRIEPYGVILLIVFLFMGGWQYVLWPVVSQLVTWVYWLFHL